MQKVLIANRGEIAVRVIRACRDEGLRSVAVYADQDADALHARLADEAWALHGATPAESYLDIPALLAAATASGADAVHPGYGFLSESAEFARAVETAGLVWIGPTPESIELLGDKLRARDIARRVGAPLAPGSQDPIGDARDAIAFAEAHGLPVIVKAAFGGGGRGLRIARSLEEVPAAFDSASREAIAAFGRGECFIERFLERPRHLEVQVLGDGEGGVLVVGDRDCSLQRRGQKLVEEAPAPGLTAEERELLHRSARELCAAVRYRGAGTVEFLRGEDGTISFLEVNTRLQVEHPVTELVADVDLVREQLRIAAGERPSFDATPAPRGHAIEFRLNAEDPGRGFLPAPGRIERLRVPAGPGIRWDAGVEEGDRIEAAFDSLAAKLIVHGDDREHAIRRARRALAELVVEGVPTVTPFHRAVLEEPAFAEVPLRVSTQWIEAELMPRLEQAPRPISCEGPTLRRLSIELDGRLVELGLPASLLSALGGVGAMGGLEAEGAGPVEARDDSVLPAPMPAALIRWLVDDGVEVEAGEELAVVSAMKMESRVAAHRAGRLERLAAEGAQLEAGTPLARIR
ncbi:Biotin carboxylase [Pseudoclavibacter triregionum]|nr:Biotin carboxylase [Pseudoclavibacter triregionum]